MKEIYENFKELATSQASDVTVVDLFNLAVSLIFAIKDFVIGSFIRITNYSMEDIISGNFLAIDGLFVVLIIYKLFTLGIYELRDRYRKRKNKLDDVKEDFKRFVPRFKTSHSYSKGTGANSSYNRYKKNKGNTSNTNTKK